MKNESWLPVVGYEGLYEVSSLGRVRNIAKGHGRTFGAVLRPAVAKTGYLMVSLYRESVPTSKTVHRLVAEAFLVNPLGKSQVNHLNFLRADNRVSNLEWTTGLENMRHAFVNGRHHPHPLIGVANGNAKLTDEAITDIRGRYAAGNVTLLALAKKHSVSKSLVFNIVHGKTWTHLAA